MAFWMSSWLIPGGNVEGSTLSMADLQSWCCVRQGLNWVVTMSLNTNAKRQSISAVRVSLAPVPIEES